MAERLMAVKPEVPVIMAGYLDEEMMAEKGRAAGIWQFLAKPVTRSELSPTIRGALGQ